MGIIGNWNGYFITFEKSMKLSFVSIMTEDVQLFLTCAQKTSFFF